MVALYQNYIFFHIFMGAFLALPGSQFPIAISFEQSTPGSSTGHHSISQPTGQNLSTPIIGQTPTTWLTAQSSSAPSTAQASNTMLPDQSSSASTTGQALDTLLPVEEQSPLFENLELIPKNITVHRSTLRNDVIEIFKDPEIFKYNLVVTITDVINGTLRRCFYRNSCK